MLSVKFGEGLEEYLKRGVPFLIKKNGISKRQATEKCRGAYIKGVKDLKAFALNCGEELEYEKVGELEYEKEVIYAGDFVKDDFEFNVDDEVLNHWDDKIKEFMELGIDIPIPKEHTQDPEANLGKITGSRVKLDSEGRSGLFLTTKFFDQDSAKIGLKNQVSIYSPPKYKDSSGKTHVYPIRHVAATSYPVINKLDGYTPIVASTSTPLLKEDEMPKILELAENIGLSLAKDVKEEEAFTAIQKEVKELRGQKILLEESKSKNKELSLSFETYKAKNPEKGPKIPVSDAIKKTILENRELKLSQLVQGSKISPVVMQRMKETFCTDEGVTLVLSENFNDRFDTFIDILAENSVVDLGSSTGPQGLVKLSKSDAEKIKGTADDHGFLAGLIK